MAVDRRRVGGYIPLRDAMNQLFETSFITPGAGGTQGVFPTADMHVTDEDVIIHMAVPGLNPDDLNISVTGETVTVSGEIKREERSERHQPLHEEIWRGRFQRSFQLPIQVDAGKADASIDNGILTLTLPKSEATKPRKIEVHSKQSKQSRGSTSQQDNVQADTVSVQNSNS